MHLPTWFQSPHQKVSSKPSGNLTEQPYHSERRRPTLKTLSDPKALNSVTRNQLFTPHTDYFFPTWSPTSYSSPSFQSTITLTASMASTWVIFLIIYILISIQTTPHNRQILLCQERHSIPVKRVLTEAGVFPLFLFKLSSLIIPCLSMRTLSNLPSLRLTQSLTGSPQNLQPTTLMTFLNSALYLF